MKRVFLIVLLFAGCSMAREAPPPATTSTSSSEASAPAADGVPAERMVIREASLQLRVHEPRKTADEAAHIVTSAGGFVLQSQLRSVEGDVSEIEVQLRVPERELDATLRKLRALGTLLAEEITGQDVTEEFVDVSARLRAQRTLESRLLALLQGSAALKDMLALEQELARVRTEIERHEGRIRYLEERSRMASIRLLAQAAHQPLASSAQSFGSRFSNAWSRSLDGAVSAAEVLITVTGYLLPPALIATALLVPLSWLRRRRIAARLAGRG